MGVQAFVVLYLMVLFLLVLNFLLAIIVEAYMKVRQQQVSIRAALEWCSRSCLPTLHISEQRMTSACIFHTCYWSSTRHERAVL